MTNLTVRQRILAGFATIVMITVVLSAFAAFLLFEIRQRATDITGDTWPGLYYTARMQALAKETHGAVYKYAFGDETDRRLLEAEIGTNRSKMDSLITMYGASIVDAEDRQLLNATTTARVSCDAIYKEVVGVNQAAKALEPRELIHKVDAACVDFMRLIDEDFEHNRANGDESNQRILSAVGQAQLAVVLGLLAGITFAIICGYFLVQAINRPLANLVSTMEVMRTGNLSKRVVVERKDEFGSLGEGLNLMASDLTSLIQRVQQSGIQVSTSSTEIAATAQEQLSTANEIAATTSEVGATSKEISATAKELVHTVKQVTEVAEKTTALATSGQAGLTRMKTTVEQIVDASRSITDRLAVLNEKASNIGAVVTAITKVADQTNLLSLNAAIEAEKAGDAGRGFAVVATEIRRLADQTAISTSDIEQTVKEMQSAVAAGVMGMDKFSEELRRGVEVVRHVGDELSQIMQQVQTLTPSFEAVSEGMQSQSLGAQQISDALSQLSEASKQTVMSLRQSNVAVEQLNDAARGLQTGVARFTLGA
jgi:methyl-accepting chemotaxis protein WspA